MSKQHRSQIALCLIALYLVSMTCGAQERAPLFTADSKDSDVDSSRQTLLSDDELLKLRQRDLLMDFKDDTTLDHGATIHPRLMETVRDNTMGIRFEEREAYLRILRLSQQVPLRRQEEFATALQEDRRQTADNYRHRRLEDFPQFVDLFTHPDVYKGRPVTLHGTMRKLTKFDIGKNSLDLDQVYEGWLYTPDSQGNPTVVVFTSKDERLPVAGDMQEEVRFTGYFFKMYGYDAHDTTRKAPLLIAGEVQCVPHPYRPAYHGINLGWYVFTTIAFLLGCYTVWQVNRIEMPPRPLPQVEPDFKHFPPREHPATAPDYLHTISETEDA